MFDTFRNPPSPTTVVVHFATRVRGPGPEWTEPAPRLNTWHAFDANEMIHEDGEMLFLLEHEVVASWLSDLITRVEWYPSENGWYGSYHAQRVNQDYQEQLARQRERQAERRRRYPRLGQPWTEEEEEQLRREHDDGLTLIEMAARHERTRGGITTRLDKMALPWPPSEPTPSGADDGQGWLRSDHEQGSPVGDEPPEPEHGPSEREADAAGPGTVGPADEPSVDTRHRLNGASSAGPGNGPGGPPEGGTPVAPASPDAPIAPLAPLVTTPPPERAPSDSGTG